MGSVLKRLAELISGLTGFNRSGQKGSSENRFLRFNKMRLLLLALVLLGLWYLAAPAVLSEQEDLMWERVRSAQLHISQWRQSNGTGSMVEDDPWNCGLIGPEWSGITTTLGELSSKRTACNPAWAVQFSRWFRELGLKPNDHIALYSSGSFPGMMLNAIVAAEAMQLEPLLLVSLGSSTWGANHPESPWPVLAAELRRNGFIHKRADYYTLGAGGELGHGLSPEGEALLREAADKAGVELLTASNLQEMIARKTQLLEAFQPKLFISIGGSQANLGDSDEVLRLPPGLIPGSQGDLAGNGVIGAAVRAGTPVIHMLNIKSISNRVGIPYGSYPRKTGPVRSNIGWSCLGLLLFFTILFTHRRWRLESVES